MYHLLTLAHRYYANRILTRFTVRIHSSVVRAAGARWVKLWYVLRGLDADNSGNCQISLTDIQELLGCKESTVYEWLREGEWAGAFRRWQIRRGILKVFLGGLTKLCLQLGLTPARNNWAPWGAVALVPLHQIKSFIRPLATAAATQQLQQDSHFAAQLALSAAERERFKIPSPQELFTKLQPSVETSANPKSHTGAIPCLLHVGAHRLFTSKGFIPYGASQIKIAEALNYRSDRTLRRHYQLLRINKRQLVQAKAGYGEIRQMLGNDAAVNDEGYFTKGKGNEEVCLCRLEYEEYPDDPSTTITTSKLFEANGRTSSRYEAFVDTNRFFRYFGKDWIYRCNLYEPLLKLCSMAERAYQYLEGKPSARVIKRAYLQKNSKKAAPACSIERVTGCTITLASLHVGVLAIGSAVSISPTNGSSSKSSDSLVPFSPAP